MSDTQQSKQQADSNVPCPACGTQNDAEATVCRRCGAALPAAAGKTEQIGGRTSIISPAKSGGGKEEDPRFALRGQMGPHLVAPKDLDLGVVRGGETVRGRLRIANNGTSLLTGTARAASNAPWLRILGSGTIYCAAGAVEPLDVQVATNDLPRGRQVGSIAIESDGGRATVQVVVTVVRDSLAPAVVAAVVTAAIVLVLSGVLYAARGGPLPFVGAGATSTPTRTATPLPSATPTIRPTSTPTISPTPAPSATTVNLSGTATAEARLAAQAQQLVANAHATATAVADSLNATATAVNAAANRSPEAMAERVAIEAAVNNFLLVRAHALATGDDSQLAGVAGGRELTILQAGLQALAKQNEHYRIRTIDPPVWDAIDLHGTGSADATLTKHEDELIILPSGQPDDVDPSYKGHAQTARNQRYSVTYKMQLVNGVWMVVDSTLFGTGTPQPTPQPDLLPPANQGPVTTAGTATAVPTAATSTSNLSIEQVVNLALPAVLRITASTPNNQQSTGTGFVVQTSGNFAYVVTNDHVVNGATDVELSNQTTGPIPAISVQEDTADDLAVIKIVQPSAHPLPALSWADSDQAQLGENVVTIGFALGLQGEPTVSSGIISALRRDVGQRWLYLQHTAPINHGNSGGPLLDMQGNVIGVNTLLDENAQSVYFAIPSARAEKKVNELIGQMP